MKILGKKGDKSLQMIFGLFILLIISLVVLSLFFKFSEKSTSQMQSSTKDYFSKANVEGAIQECKNLCNNIDDVNGIIEFCGMTQQIDFDGDELLVSKVSRGKYDFCEGFVPCFVLVDNCKNKYNGEQCARVLQSQRPDYYNRFLNRDDQLGDDPCGVDIDEPAYWKNATGFNNVAGGGNGGGGNTGGDSDGSECEDTSPQHTCRANAADCFTNDQTPDSSLTCFNGELCCKP